MKLHISLLNAFLLITAMTMAVSASAQWTNINSFSNHSFEELDFPSQQTGYGIVGLGGNNGNALFKTEDAGITWAEITIDLDSITSPRLQSIFFVDAQTGFLSFRARVTNLDIFLLKTQDGGNSWTNVTPDSLPNGYGISDVFFTNSNQGFVASGNRLYRTTDGGMSWVSSLKLRWEGFNDIHFHDDNFGITGAWDGTFAYMGLIFTTSNGGQSWDSLILNQYNTAIGKVMHVGDSTAFAMTDQAWQGQKIFTTTNNGNSWDTLFLPFLKDSSDQAMDFHFEDASNGYLITSNGYIYRTNDCGKSWVQEHAGVIGLEDLATNGSTFFVGGPVNTLLTTPNTLSIDGSYLLPDGFLYPNPCSRNEVLNFKEPLTGELRVFDLNGKLVYFENIKNETQLLIQEIELVPGVYFIQMMGKKPYSSKLVITE